jgi:hypothetical protein
MMGMSTGPTVDKALEQLQTWLVILADPVKARERIAEFLAAATEAREQIGKAETDMAAVKAAHQQSEAALDAKFQAQTDRMERETAEHQATIKRERDDIERDKKEAAALLATAKADAAAAAGLKAKLDRKLTVLQEVE